jgi:tetratricopeptide (TPR) repeat protein
VALAAAALIALVFAIWWPALGASFQFDDFNVIVADARVHSLAAWLASMPGIRPLLKLSYALNYAWDPGPRGFRLVNVAIHAANACLVGALLWRRACAHGLAPRAAGAAATLATLVFALHPVQTEAVTYVSGRSVSLAALPCLLALAAWLAAADAATPRRALAWRGVALLAFALALAVKETTLVLPLALLLWSVTEPRAPRAGGVAAAGRVPDGARTLLPMFVLAAAAVAVALLWAPYRRLLDTSLAIRPVSVNLMTQAHALGYLAAQLVRPWGMNADPALPVTARLDASTVLLGLLWIAVAAAGLALLRRRPAIAFGLLWFLLWLLPTNSLLPRYDVANDRQLYLALIGPAWLFGLGVAAVARGRVLRWMPVAAAVGALLAVATVQRNRVYADEIRYWKDVVRKSPASPRAANNLGMAYAFACRDAEALREFERALRLQPGYIRARINLNLLREDALFPDPDAGGAVRADLGVRHCEAPPQRAGP